MENKDFILNELNAQDAAVLSHLMVSNQQRFQRFFPITLSQNLTEEASKSYILLKQMEIKLQTEYTYAIRESENQQVVGLLILKNIDWEKKEGELAYCIDKKFEGRGWMTNAVKQFSQIAFEKGLKTVQIVVHHTNKPSLRVAEKCGYLWRGTLEKHHIPPGEYALDMELYKLEKTAT